MRKLDPLEIPWDDSDRFLAGRPLLPNGTIDCSHASLSTDYSLAVLQWCDDHLGGVEVVHGPTVSFPYARLRFASMADLIAFKLRWL